jgi:16S rRNA (adenine1518-N6/adenine1519-N6)-dimethyltransferase
VATVRNRRQRLGQHFLRDAATAHAIVAALADTPPRVLEIGPGKGDLTRPLLERFAAVRAVELDNRLAATLPRRLGDPANLEVRHGDGLTLDLDEAADGGPWQVAANLPYSVGTPILRRLLLRHDLFTVLVVMVQAEVARRLVAADGGAGRGLLTLEAEAYGRAELLFTVPPRCFSPPPRVTSAVVRLTLHPPPAPPPTVESALGFASVAFTHRRKKLANALASVGSPDEIAAALAAVGARDEMRPQDLSLELWLALAGALPASRGA